MVNEVGGRDAGEVEEEWQCFKEGVMLCAKVECRMRQMGGGRRKGCEWWSDEVRVKVCEKRQPYEERLQIRTGEAYEKYKEKRVEVKRIVREAKRRGDERIGNSMAKDF